MDSTKFHPQRAHACSVVSSTLNWSPRSGASWPCWVWRSVAALTLRQLGSSDVWRCVKPVACPTEKGFATSTKARACRLTGKAQLPTFAARQLQAMARFFAHGVPCPSLAQWTWTLARQCWQASRASSVHQCTSRGVRDSLFSMRLPPHAAAAASSRG